MIVYLILITKNIRTILGIDCGRKNYFYFLEHIITSHHPGGRFVLTVLLEVKNLTVRFDTDEGTVYAVNDVSYTLHEGETLGIVGESGSGKSVHALTMMGLIPIPPGRVRAR